MRAKSIEYLKLKLRQTFCIHKYRTHREEFRPNGVQAVRVKKQCIKCSKIKSIDYYF